MNALPESSVPAIVGARRSDLPSIRWILDVEFLSSADITEESLEHFLVNRDQLGVAGVIGLRMFGEVELLRSLVVTRSILAEAILNKQGRGKFRAFSAGSHPKGQVHPIALELLNHLGFPTENLRSKSWEEFAAPNSPHLDASSRCA